GTSEVCLTPAGLRYVEDQQIARPSLIRRNQSVRRAILEHLAQRYEQSAPGGHFAYDYQIRDNRISDSDFQRNIAVLIDENLVSDGYSVCPYYQITELGYANVQRFRVREEARSKFAALDQPDLTAKQRRSRGHELEQLLAAIFRSEGWEVHTNDG